MKYFAFFIIILFLSPAVSTYSQVRIVTFGGDEYYGIVTDEDSESVTILKKDGFRQVVQLKEITLLKETDANIITKDSLSYKVHIYFIDNDSVYYDIGKNKAQRSIPRSKVLEINYYSGEESGQIEGLNEVKPSVNNNGEGKNLPAISEQIVGSYWMYGLTVLCPGGINLLLGKQSDNGFGWRLQGGLSPDMKDYLIYGAQWNFMYNLKKTKDVEHNLSVGLGITTFEFEKLDYRWKSELFYTGFFYDVNVNGFFLETGIAFAEANVSKPFMFIQLGYVFR